MAKNGKQLNNFELKLQEDIEALMVKCDKKFSVFLSALRSDLVSDKTSDDYKNQHKAEYLKQLRASYSVEEIKNMLAILDYKMVLTLDGNVIEPVKYNVNKGIKNYRDKTKDDTKVKYTDFMMVCELLGITIEWVKITHRAYEDGAISK